MYPYRLNSTNPIDRQGMECLFNTSAGDLVAAEVYPVADTTDDIVVYRHDDDDGCHGYTTNAPDTWVTVDLHDPIIALQIVRRFVAIKGYVERQNTVRNILLSLHRDDEVALSNRVTWLRLLLSDIDPSDVPAADADKES